MHALLAAAVIALDSTVWLALALLGAVAAHAVARRPRRPDLLVHDADGTWSIPTRRALGLRLARGTAWSTWWVELVLRDDRGRTRILILRDQLGAEDWRRLQLTVREHDGHES